MGMGNRLIEDELPRGDEDDLEQCEALYYQLDAQAAEEAERAQARADWQLDAERDLELLREAGL